MPITSASACAKLILLGEHAVVYGYPAIAVPFTGLRLRTAIEPGIGKPSGTIHIFAPQLLVDADLIELPADHIIARTIDLVLHFLDLPEKPTCDLRIHSDIPFSSGLGSSAALSISIIRALSNFLGHPLQNDEINTLAYQTEQLVHGRPSGIDNTVITYENPIYFVKGKITEQLRLKGDLHFLVADTGIQKSTAVSVAQIAQLREKQPDFVNERFEKIGEWVKRGRVALENTDEVALGNAMNADQQLLSSLGLSSPEIDNLIAAAMDNKAYGAKLTGGGQGGHVLILVAQTNLEAVQTALEIAGAKFIYKTSLHPA